MHACIDFVKSREVKVAVSCICENICENMQELEKLIEISSSFYD